MLLWCSGHCRDSAWQLLLEMGWDGNGDDVFHYVFISFIIDVVRMWICVAHVLGVYRNSYRSIPMLRAILFGGSETSVTIVLLLAVLICHNNMKTRQDGVSTIKGLLIVLNLTTSNKYPQSPSRATQGNEMACRTNGNQHTRYQPNTASIRHLDELFLDRLKTWIPIFASPSRVNCVR